MRTGAGVRALCAIILGRSVDAVAFLKLVLLHAGHVVFHDLRRIGHALRPRGGRLHGERKPQRGRQSGCGEQTTIHDVYLSWSASRFETDNGRFARDYQRLPGRAKILSYRCANNWCIPRAINRATITSGLKSKDLTKAYSMSSGQHLRPAQLTLVAAPSTDEMRKAGCDLDWSMLMARAQNGDRQAYRTLLEDITPYLRSLAARCFKQSSDIEDVVQDVLLTIHMVRHAYDPSRSFGPWLVAIANRRFIDRLRRETRLKAREITLSTEHETFPEPPTNLDRGISEEAALSEAIKRLPLEQRQAVTLLKLNEMSLKEAAAVSGRSIAALKVATHRAIKNLRTILKKQSD